jgi:hypothetical protein
MATIERDAATSLKLGEYLAKVEGNEKSPATRIEEVLNRVDRNRQGEKEMGNLLVRQLDLCCCLTARKQEYQSSTLMKLSSKLRCGG